MSNGAPEPPYSLDTSSLMEWQARYYPLDVFPSVAAKVSELIEAGRFLAAGLVHEDSRCMAVLLPNGKVYKLPEPFNVNEILNVFCLSAKAAISLSGVSSPKGRVSM